MRGPNSKGSKVPLFQLHSNSCLHFVVQHNIFTSKCRISFMPLSFNPAFGLVGKNSSHEQLKFWICQFVYCVIINAGACNICIIWNLDWAFFEWSYEWESWKLRHFLAKKLINKQLLKYERQVFRIKMSSYHQCNYTCRKEHQIPNSEEI